MDRPAVDSATRRPANHDRRGSVPQIMTLGDEIRDLVERANDEIDELHFANGPQAEVAHPARCADNGAFADGRINHALPTKALEQSFAGLERPAIHANVLAHSQDRRIALHLLKPGLPG